MDLAHRLDKVHAVVVVLVYARGDGEDVRVEDDVLGREADPLREEPVGAGADLHLPLLGIGLPLLIESHHDHGRPVPLEQPRLPDELFLALLHADGVDDGLALHPLQSRLDDRPLGGVDHDGHPRDVRLCGDEVQELDHRLLSVEHPLVHVHVYDLRPVLDLAARHVERRLVVAVQDQVLEPRRPRHVRPLPDVDEQ